MREFHALWQQWEVLAREYRPTQSMIREIANMREQLEELDQQEKVAKELDHQRHVLTLLGIVSQAAEQSKGKLRVTELQVIDLQRTRPTREHPSAAPQGGNLVLIGLALDSPSVAELLDRLQQTGLFNGVELISLKEREEEGVVLNDFQVRCQL
jgi:Tfp pilus assembly protein PilN